MDDLRNLGLSEEQAIQMLDGTQDDAIEIWPENVSTVNLFFLTATQWRFEFGAFIDYCSVKQAAEFSGLTITTEEFNGFQTMERAVRMEFSNEQ